MLILLVQAVGLMLPAMSEDKREPNQIIVDPISGLIRDLRPAFKALGDGVADVQKAMARWKLYWTYRALQRLRRELEQQMRLQDEWIRRLKREGDWRQLDDFYPPIDERLRKRFKGLGNEA